MKKIFSIIVLLGMVALSGCNYLDIVPEERTKESDTYQNPVSAKRYLYSCYSFIPDNRISDAVDKFSAAEIANGVEKSEFVIFPRGYYSPSAPSLTSALYNSIWTGIRQCYQFLSVVDKTPKILPEDLQYYKAEATLLIGFYHFLSLRSYGPTTIMDRIYSYADPIENLPERSSIDEVVAFIDSKITEALPNLSETFTGDDYGRFTKSAALALRSRLYLYAASPLLNGNSEYYASFKSSKDGRALVPQTFDPQKWVKSAEATKSAIDHLESSGFRLYSVNDAGQPSNDKPGPVDPYQRAVRYTFMDNVQGSNPELIMVDCRKEGTYAIQNQSTPSQLGSSGYKNSWNIIAPTLQMVELFYTKNGLPIEEDTEFDYANRYKMVAMPKNHDNNNYFATSNGNTLSLHLNREPRFYAWIGFHNGNYEIAKFNGSVTNANNAKKAIIVKFRKNDGQGIGEKTANFSITGYLNKKFVHPAFQNGPVHYPYPVIRMAEMYLNYAEALIEVGGAANLNIAKTYIDKVRERAGLPKLDIAWQKALNPDKVNTQEGLRQIVRQERQIEFYLENQRFWDLRRWKSAHGILGEKVKGMNIQGITDEEFFNVTEAPMIRTFNFPAQYLMPIPMDETNKVPHLVQNPGY